MVTVMYEFHKVLEEAHNEMVYTLPAHMYITTRLPSQALLWVYRVGHAVQAPAAALGG